MNTLFALIDCNNFFVSCEKIFRPDLEGKPVVVLSSGDGCVIARSDEAKKIGVPMGAPVYKHRQLFKDNDVVCFSANFELYGDISRRITEVLTTITPRLEVYSIDESFLDVGQLAIEDYEAWGRVVRQRILQWIGVPVRIGIAPTKTLAKLASDYSKKDPSLQGVIQLTPGTLTYEQALRKTRLEEVWGIGRRQAPKLRGRSLAKAYDLTRLSDAQARSYFGSVQGTRLCAELQGMSCWPLELIGKDQKMISATRTFGEDSGEIHVIEAALASFVARATTRLRRQNLTASKLSIFLTSNRHKPGYKSWYKEFRLLEPTMDTGLLTALANQLFLQIHSHGAQYHRGGITLGQLQSAKDFQSDLLGHVSRETFDHSRSRMGVLDAVRAKHGHKGLHYASEDLALTWEPRRSLRSPRYTTSWAELKKVKI